MRWPCGHPKTDENTQSVGKAGVRCRVCRRQITLRHWHTKAKFKHFPHLAEKSA